MVLGNRFVAIAKERGPLENALAATEEVKFYVKHA